MSIDFGNRFTGLVGGLSQAGWDSGVGVGGVVPAPARTQAAVYDRAPKQPRGRGEEGRPSNPVVHGLDLPAITGAELPRGAVGVGDRDTVPGEEGRPLPGPRRARPGSAPWQGIGELSWAGVWRPAGPRTPVALVGEC